MKSKNSEYQSLLDLHDLELGQPAWIVPYQQDTQFSPYWGKSYIIEDYQGDFLVKLKDFPYILINASHLRLGKPKIDFQFVRRLLKMDMGYYLLFNETEYIQMQGSRKTDKQFRDWLWRGNKFEFYEEMSFVDRMLFYFRYFYPNIYPYNLSNYDDGLFSIAVQDENFDITVEDENWLWLYFNGMKIYEGTKQNIIRYIVYDFNLNDWM